MADGTDPANAGGDARHLVVGSAFGEFLEPAHLSHVELGACDFPTVIEMNGDLRVSFDTGHGIDGDVLHAKLLLYRVLSDVTIPYPNFTARAVSRFLPSTRSEMTAAMVFAGGGHPGRLRSTFTNSRSGRACLSRGGTPSVGTTFPSCAPST